MRTFIVTEVENGWTVAVQRPGFVTRQLVWGRESSHMLANFIFRCHETTQKNDAATIEANRAALARARARKAKAR